MVWLNVCLNYTRWQYFFNINDLRSQRSWVRIPHFPKVSCFTIYFYPLVPYLKGSGNYTHCEKSVKRIVIWSGLTCSSSEVICGITGLPEKRHFIFDLLLYWIPKSPLLLPNKILKSISLIYSFYSYLCNLKNTSPRKPARQYGHQRW